MPTKSEIDEEIYRLECSAHNYEALKALSVLYIVRDHYFGDQGRVGNYGNTEFLQAVRGMDSERAWKMMDNLMETLQESDSALYNSFLRDLQ